MVNRPSRVQLPVRRLLFMLGSVAVTLAVWPAWAQAADPSATGGGEIRFDLGFVALDYQFSMEAVTEGDGEVSGRFAFKLNAPLDFFPGGRPFLKAGVSCLELIGEDVATLSGLTRKGRGVTGEPIPAGLCWMVRAVDNGQGPGSDPDLGSLVPIFPCGGLDPAEICRDVPPFVDLTPIGVITKGNLQIRP